MASAHQSRAPITNSGDGQRQWKIDHAGKIDKPTAKILLFFFASIAVAASVLRLAFRLHHDKRIFAHDVLVIFSTLTLIPMTAVFHHLMPRMYMVEVANTDSTVVFSFQELMGLLDTPKWVFIYFALGWTTIFAIKFSFLVFFRQLIRNLSKWLEYYYWFSIVFTTISWLILAIEPVILCPHVGISAITCYPNTDYGLNLGLSLMTCILDILTDIIVVSFPVALLSMSKMSLRQKCSIAVFLCLSIAMIIITIVRIASGLHMSLRGYKEFSMTWTHIMLHVEASVAVFMGSVSAFRTIFVAQRDRERSSQGPGIYRRLLSKLGFSTQTGASAEDDRFADGEHVQLSEGRRTNLSLKTLRNFIRRHQREPGATSLGSITEVDVEDYHDYRRNETTPLKVNATKNWSMSEDRGHFTAESNESTIPLSNLTSKSSQ